MGKRLLQGIGFTILIFIVAFHCGNAVVGPVNTPHIFNCFFGELCVLSIIFLCISIYGFILSLLTPILYIFMYIYYKDEDYKEQLENAILFHSLCNLVGFAGGIIATAVTDTPWVFYLFPAGVWGMEWIFVGLYLAYVEEENVDLSDRKIEMSMPKITMPKIHISMPDLSAIRSHLPTVNISEMIINIPLPSFHAVVNDKQLAQASHYANSQLVCRICKMNSMTVSMVDCKHVVACMDCLASKKACPMCSEPILQTRAQGFIDRE